jgi:integrase
MAQPPLSGPALRWPMLALSVAPSTLTRYDTQIRNLFTHTRLSASQFLSLPARELDCLVADQLQRMFDSGRSSPAYGWQLVNAVALRRPDVRGRLPISQRCMRGWARSVPTVSHPPLPWQLTVTLACLLAHWGFVGPAVAMLLAFDCYLRASEIAGLRICDVVLRSDARMGGAFTGMAVCLPSTKGGRNQSVPVRRHAVADILTQWIRALRPRSTAAQLQADTASVFGLAPDRLRRLMARACDALRLPTKYVPHSLRHGGASADFLRSGSVEDVLFRGRWKQTDTAKTYVQSSRALLAAQHVPPHAARLGQQLEALELPTMFASWLADDREPPRARRSVARR